MAGHSRRHSRGSIFSFTIDAVRSLSRVGSRQVAAIRVDDEEQLPSEPPAVSDVPQASHSTAVANVSSAVHITPSDSNVPPTAPKARMPRPLSWLPTQRYRKNKVGRSISAPVLTSTTNANVARVEGVRCGELTQADLIQSTWNPQVGWIPESAGVAEHVEKAGNAEAGADEVEGSTRNGTGRLRSEIRKPRSTTFSKLKGTIRGHLDSMTVARRPSIPEKTQFSKLEESSVSSIARRRAEGISLCKQKIRNLTGHGNVKRKPMEKIHPLSAKNISERHNEERPLLMSVSTSSPGRLDDTAAYPNLSRDYTFGDLEKSFMNAVDKLDFHQNSQQAADSIANPHRHSLLPGLYQQDLKTANTRRATTANDASINASRPEPYAFSVSQANLIPTPGNGRRPTVNPLKCHPNVAGFAEQLVDTSGVSRAPLGASGPRIEITKEVAEDLEHAPIYSPSSGNLSHYARLTPSPARSTPSSFHTAPLLAPGTLHEIPDYTPTRPSGRSASTEYAAHQKNQEMAARRSHQQPFSDHEQARKKENRRHAKPSDVAIKSKTTPTEGDGGGATRTGSPNMQQKPHNPPKTHASGTEGQMLSAQKAQERETPEKSQ